MNKLLVFLFWLPSSMALASGSALKSYLEDVFYWIAGIGFFISVGVIAAAKMWPDTFIEQLAQRYSKALLWAVFGFIAFGIFRDQIASFFVWLSDPLAGIVGK